MQTSIERRRVGFSGPGPPRADGRVVLFCIGCLVILTLGQRVSRLPLVGRSDRLHAVYRRVAVSTRFSRPTFVAGLLLLGCWTSRALGSALLLNALGVRFSPTIALVVVCVNAATAILPITAGGAVAGMGTTAGVLLALGVSKNVALNFSLAPGLLLTSAALTRGGSRTDRFASACAPRSPGAPTPRLERKPLQQEAANAS